MEVKNSYWYFKSVLSKEFCQKVIDLGVNTIESNKKIGKDVEGKKFKPYSRSYKARKALGRVKRQSSTSSKVDLQLTGDMMRNLQTRGFTNNQVTIGWSSTNAQKIQWNADMGRIVTKKSMPVPRGVQKFILNKVDNFIKDNAKQATSKPITLKIGKR